MSGIEIEERFGDQALLGLADFSHVQVLYVFHLAQERAGRLMTDYVRAGGG